jgi:hypothetical protein
VEFGGSVELSSVAKRKRVLLVSHSGLWVENLIATANKFHDAKGGQNSANVDLLTFSFKRPTTNVFLDSFHAADKTPLRTSTVPSIIMRAERHRAYRDLGKAGKGRLYNVIRPGIGLASIPTNQMIRSGLGRRSLQ